MFGVDLVETCCLSNFTLLLRLSPRIRWFQVGSATAGGIPFLFFDAVQQNGDYWFCSGEGCFVAHVVLSSEGRCVTEVENERCPGVMSDPYFFLCTASTCLAFGLFRFRILLKFGTVWYCWLWGKSLNEICGWFSSRFLVYFAKVWPM